MEFPRQEYGVGCHFLLQRIFMTLGLNLCFLHWQADSLPLSILRSPTVAVFKGSIWGLFSRVITYTFRHTEHTRGWQENRLLGLKVTLTGGRLLFQRRNLIPWDLFY